MKKTKRIASLIIAVVMLFSFAIALVACKDDNNPDDKVKKYTFNDYVSASPSTFNPHTWETDGDSYIMGFTTMGFVDSIYHKEGNVESYEWCYEMATEIKDITADATDAQKEKYGIKADDEGRLWGRMWQISLNPLAKWQDGTAINADDYIYSMQMLLSPEFKNSRADLYRTGESSVFNADDYARQGSSGWFAAADCQEAYSSDLASKLIFKLGPKTDAKPNGDALSDLRAGMDGATAYGFDKNMTGSQYILHYASATGTSIEATAAAIDALEGKTIAEILSSAEMKATLDALCAWTNVIVGVDLGTDAYLLFTICEYTFPAVDFADVGLYKVDDHKIVYVTSSQIDEFNFFVSCGSTWLVNKKLYDAGITTTGDLKSTNYATSMETYSSYGPYKLSSFETTAFTLTRNENWYGWTDGKHENQFQTTDIKVSILTDENTIKQMFLKGELDSWSLTADDMAEYGYSDYLQQVEDGYSMKFFFNGDLEALQKLEQERNDGNNISILSLPDFRKAISLAFDRRAWCAEVTAGDKPAVSLICNVVYYDAEHGLTYRSSEIVKKEICSYYGMEYGEGKKYATLDEAYNAISGFDLNKAKELFTSSYNEAKSKGLITDSQKVVIHVAAAKGAATAELAAQEKKFNDFLATATVGTPLEGRLSVKYYYNIEDRYGDVPAGKFECGYGGLGGALFYAFRALNSYLNKDYAVGGKINEGGFDNNAPCEITMPDGTKVTKSYADWCVALNEGGEYYGASNEVKLTINAQLEAKLLDLCYMFPVSFTSSVSLTSQKVKYITENYDVFYAFGGIRFMTYNYSDAEWADYVKSQGGTLSYK